MRVERSGLTSTFTHTFVERSGLTSTFTPNFTQARRCYG